MKISSEIQSIVNVVGEDKALAMMGKAGFDAWDFSMFNMKTPKRSFFRKKYGLVTDDYLKFARHMKEVGLRNGMVCNQSHAPFPSLNDDVFPYLERALECTAEAGGNICVMHPDNNLSAEKNAEWFLKLLPTAKQYGVKIAVENMWNWDKLKNQAAPAACSDPESFLAHIHAVNDPYFVAVLDIGHAEMRGLNTSAVEMIHALDTNLQALHIHDNDRHHDSHQIPFSMNVDFDAIVKALKDIHYDGYFTLEADSYMAKYKHHAMQGVQNLTDAGRKLADMFEAL